MKRNSWIVLCLACIAGLAPAALPQETGDADLLVASYDTVWQTVNENHFDSTFGGLDWNEIHDRYYDLVAAADCDSSFIEIVTRMLRELKLSHYAVFKMQEKARSGSPLISAGEIGIDLRLLDDEAVVTSLKPGLPAARAGLKPGCVIESFDGVAVDRIVADARSEQLPHSGERRRHANVTDAVQERVFGEPDTRLVVAWRDGTDARHEDTLYRQERTEKTIIDELLPPFYVDFTARRLEGNIGYVSFNAFVPPVDEKFSTAIDSMLDVRGLIVDIRGNPGGMHEVGEAIAARLLAEPTLFSIFRYRNETDSVVVEPSGRIYDGPVVVLIDGLNASASERFSACLQSVGRAVVVGDRSQGSVGPSNLKKLPNGASFMYLVAQSTTPDGTVLEGRGVIPDIAVGLDREALLNGVDTQLGRAVEYILSRTD